MALSLLRRGIEVTSIDTSPPPKVLQRDHFVHVAANLLDQGTLAQLFAAARFDAVMHFASLIQAGESTTVPMRYYQNNLGATLSLLTAMLQAGVNRFIFSSSAAIYGEPSYTPIDEAHPKVPINPYGCSKAMVEEILTDLRDAYDLQSVALRYFNAAGASPKDALWESHLPETHLIPLAIRAARDPGAPLTVFRADYRRSDGTAIRDFVHVSDICSAHSLALDYLLDDGLSTQFNLGSQRGFSVLEVIRTTEAVLGCPVPFSLQPRRVGDPAILLADSQAARQELNWKPSHSDLATMIADAAAALP